MDKSELIKTIIKSTAIELSGTYRETEEGVPHIVVKGKDCCMSIVYVAKSNQWKVFFPFPPSEQEQQKMYFENKQQLKHFLISQGVGL